MSSEDIGRTECWVLGARRTPFGAYGGAFKAVHATELGAHAARAALAQAGVEGDAVDQVIFGNVLQSSSDDVYCARHVGLRAGLPDRVPALTVNRLCGSGMQAIISAVQEIRTGEANVVLVGGTESMSLAPHVLRGARWGYAFGKTPPVEDALWSALHDDYAGCSMGITAENVAARYGVDRAACDELALCSQRRFAAAQDAGRFREEIAPLTVASKKGPAIVERDEHPRPDTTGETLAKLKPAFLDGGVVTAGNASGISDGAAALVIASRGYAERSGHAPLARIVSWGVVGVEPKLMGMGPVPAMSRALERAALSIHDMDLVEVNEAFAAQYVAVEREAELPRERTNVDGGAIALGHPLAASGARLVSHLVYELRRRKARYGIAAACIGGGQGIAVIIETLL